MSTRADFQQAIDDQVSQAKFTGTAQHNKAIAKAVQTYAKHRPRVLVRDLDATGSHVGSLFILDGWEDAFSQVRGVEYPVDDTKAAKNLLDAEEWTVYQSPQGKELHLLTTTGTAGEAIRVTFTALHVVDDSGSTIPAADEVAVQSLAAACFCRMLAAAYAESIDSNIAADSVDQMSKRREYEAMAKVFEREFSNDTGINPGQPGPAAGVVDWDLNLSNGRDRITHPRRLR
jgi:hypothetical protein